MVFKDLKAQWEKIYIHTSARFRQDTGSKPGIMPCCLCEVLIAPGLLCSDRLGQEVTALPPASELFRSWTWTPNGIRTERASGPCRRISASLVSHDFLAAAQEACSVFHLVLNRETRQEATAM